jgi:hypothetical protein
MAMKGSRRQLFAQIYPATVPQSKTFRGADIRCALRKDRSADETAVRHFGVEYATLVMLCF